MNFTYLNTKSHYSLNGSNITFSKMIEKAKDFGFSSLAIADKKMHGAISFYKECKKNDLKPIIGFEAILEGVNPESRNNVLLYAIDNNGFSNLLKLSSIEALNGYISLAEMKRHKSGVLGIYLTNNSELIKYHSNNMRNEFIEVINSLNEVFSDYFVSFSKVDELDEYFNSKNKLIYCDIVFYLEQEDFEISQILKKIFNINVESLFDDENQYYYRKFNKEEYEYVEALNNVSYVIEHCNVDIDFNKAFLPSFPMKEQVSTKEYLSALVFKGLDKRMKGKKLDKTKYTERINYELKVINNMGYNDYFLIVWDFVKYARGKGYLVGPGRGSAAASLVSYCLGITSVDSLEYDLVFERFLNPERITLPDIDMDLPDDKRDDIISYVNELYGHDKVASICTFGTFQAKSAIRDTARILHIEGLIVDEVIKHLAGYETIVTAINQSSEIKNIMSQNEQARRLINIASRIEGLNRHTSTHAAGIIVSPDPIINHTPLQNGLLGMNQTQFEAKDLEALGLLKIDFLGLKNLSIIKKILQLIELNENKVIDIYKVPLDDVATYKLLQKVETTGVFQLESQGMRSLIGQMQMREFEDIVTVLALFRPGPMESIPKYIKRRFGKEEVTYPHKDLVDVLKITNGIIIYQEQIVKIASVFAGYSLGEADLLRRAVSKKQESVLEKERANFVAKATELGRDSKVSNEIYDYIVKFANYGFNRAHSVAYAMVSYWMAYLKANYPKYFISVLTSSVIGSEKQMRNYIYEAYKLDVKILKPSVNLSSNIFSPEGEDLRYPLLGIKNLGINSVRSLLEERSKGTFNSYVEFVSRTHTLLNKRVIDSLIKAGALDEFGYTKRTMIEKLEEVISFSLLGGYIDSNEFVLDELAEYDYQTLETFEASVLGFNLSMSPINEYESYIKKHKLIMPSTLNNRMTGKEIRIIGIITYIRKIKTKHGKDMAFITIMDQFSKVEGVLFSNMYLDNKDILEKNKVFLFKAKVEERSNSLQLVINNLHKL